MPQCYRVLIMPDSDSPNSLHCAPIRTGHEYAIGVYYSCAKAACGLPLDKYQLMTVLRCMLCELSALGYNIDAVDLNITNDHIIAALNGDFLGRSGPTNIISFPSDDGMPGILALSLDTCLRESVIYRQKPDIYLCQLLAHALAHLAGFEHGHAMDGISARCLKVAIQLLSKDNSR